MLPLPQRKDPVFHGGSGQEGVLLLRLPGRRRHDRLRGKDRKTRVPGRGQPARAHGGDGGPHGRAGTGGLPQAGEDAEPEPRGGPLLSRESPERPGEAREGIHGRAAHRAEDGQPFRSRVCAGRMGCPDHGDGEKGIRQGGSPRRGARGEKRQGTHLRPLPQPADLSDHRRQRQRAGIRRPCPGRLQAQVSEFAGKLRLSQIQQSLRSEPGEEYDRNQLHHRRGVYGRPDASSGGLHERRGVAGHGADGGAVRAPEEADGRSDPVLRQR